MVFPTVKNGAPVASITVKLLDTRGRVYFVYPTHSLQHSDQSQDPDVRGTVRLFLPSRRKIKSLRVKLVGTCSAYAQGDYGLEKTVTLKSEVDFAVAHELDAGEHQFPFSFVIPSSTAVSNGSKGEGPFGLVRHEVTGVVEFATGFFRHVESRSKTILIKALNCEPGDLPAPLMVSQEYVSMDLGPTRILAYSPNLTQGALVNVRVFVAALTSSRAVTIRLVRPYLVQTYNIQYKNPKRPRIFDVPLHFTHVDEANLGAEPTPSHAVNHVVQPGVEWSYEGIFRVPDCESAWASTLLGSDAIISISHQLAVEFRYSIDGSPKVKLSRVELPVTVWPCVSLDDSLRLPEYTQERKDVPIKFAAVGSLCHCSYSVPELLQLYGNLLQQGGKEMEIGRDSGENTAGRWKDAEPLGLGRPSQDEGAASL